MTKSVLIKRTATTFPQTTVKDVEMSSSLILEVISAKLGEGKRVKIRGFGSFGINFRPSRVGRSPKSGTKVYVLQRQCRNSKLVRSYDCVSTALQLLGMPSLLHKHRLSFTPSSRSSMLKSHLKEQAFRAPLMS